MYCIKCGQQLPEEALFCPVCGTPVATINNRTIIDGPIKTEIFNWGILDDNSVAINQTNSWLKKHKIIVESISTQARYGSFSKTSILNHLEIKYRESKDGFIHEMKYFAETKLFGNNFSSLDKKYEDWVAKNPEVSVVAKTRNGHQGVNTPSSMTIFCLYIPQA